jgi:hypothetical protein
MKAGKITARLKPATLRYEPVHSARTKSAAQLDDGIAYTFVSITRSQPEMIRVGNVYEEARRPRSIKSRGFGVRNSEL